MKAKPTLWALLTAVVNIIMVDIGVTGLFNNGVGWLWLFMYSFGLIGLTLQIRRAIKVGTSNDYVEFK